MSGRFRPGRAGVVNLWDYRDDEFVFADGRLVLRGPNGSGKTKALEVLFPFVLDGRIEPRRLNPFASEDRTMKSNLLYRGQDSTHAYVWMEFAREHADTASEFVTVGVGLRAQRHNDRVTRWYFVADGRAGVDFSLLGPDDRPLTRKQLAAELGPDALTDKPVEHRAAIDARLFGLGTERYEQLLTLVLTLRRPQLAKHLDPKGLSRTLSDGLRPLDDALVAEAARSFDDMESVQRTLSGLVAADDAARAFLTGYVTYLRTHARAAADVVGARLAAVERTRAALARAQAGNVEAARRAQEAGSAVGVAETELATQRAHLESLQRSKAYTAKEQLDDLVRLVQQLEKSARAADRQAGDAAGLVARRQDEQDRAHQYLADAGRAVSRAAARLTEDARDAGIAWEIADADATDDFGSRVTARVEVRRDDIAAVRAALDELSKAQAERVLRDDAFAAAAVATQRAETELRARDDAVAAARAAAALALGRWSAHHGATLAELGVHAVENELTPALERLGEPEEPSLAERFDALVSGQARARRDALIELRGARTTAAASRGELRERRTTIAEHRDDEPRPFPARVADRTGRAGTPLWRAVHFADDLPEGQAAAVEAALEAANLLDAWIHPDAAATADEVERHTSDGYLVPLPPGRRPAGPTLADLLVAEDDCAVGAGPIGDVLTSIAVNTVNTEELPAGPQVSVGGAFAQGVQVGAHHKDRPEYIGATARARRRAERIAELDRAIAAADDAIAVMDRDILAAQALLDAVATARDQLPPTRGVLDALRSQADAAVALAVQRTPL
ncbi:MAG: hypothetical protein L0H84_00190, partial [Pseudonocardia sp.]|nr:hypothetical protein [Pseudonocardia sp.]